MKIRYMVLSTLIAGVAWFLVDQIEPKRNRENADQIRPGMTAEEVIQHMGEPETKKSSQFRSPEIDTVYSYRAPFGSSDGIYITFDKSGKVVYIANE